MGFPSGSDSNESACNSGDLGSIPGSGNLPGMEWHPTPCGLQSTRLQRVRHGLATFVHLLCRHLESFPGSLQALKL